jgi:NAD+ kinase
MSTTTSGTSASPPQVVVLAAPNRAEIFAQAQALLPEIAKLAPAELLPISPELNLADHQFSLAVVVGGDGSILRAAHQMGTQQRPVVGVNMGKLGFLADLTVEEFLDELPTIMAGQYSVIEHLMFDCQLIRAGSSVCKHLGLNEVAVLSGPPFAILDVDLYVDAEWVTTYSCDGLIVSTPVGSTAHNLSAGGPILRQDLQAFVVSPVSPHTLTNRPVVDSAERVYELVVPRPHRGTSLVADGRLLDTLQTDDRVRVTRAEPRFQLVKLAGRGYYRTLREKLGWGGQLRRNHEQSK